MATVTPNFNWPVPTSTDLVKDGATAIEALGDAIDTSMVDLKGGTTGQVLAKASSADMDFSWSSPTTGDITGVTAGTGISGGGTSGDVTITNSMATAIDAKGDLVVGTGADAFSRLAVGTNDQVLTADSTTATGLKWATPASGSTYAGVSLAASANQNIGNSTSTAIVWDQENFDTNGYHDNATNNTRVTIPSGKAGKYQVNLLGNWYNNSTGVRVLAIYVNGTVFKGVKMQAQTEEQSQVIALTLNLSVGDYVEGYVFQNSGGTRVFYASGDQGHMSMSYLGA